MPVNEDMLAVGAIQAGAKERQLLAKKSHEWTCNECKKTNKQIADEFMLDENDQQAEEELKKAGAGMPQLNLTSESQVKEIAKKFDEEHKTKSAEVAELLSKSKSVDQAIDKSILVDKTK